MVTINLTTPSEAKAAIQSKKAFPVGVFQWAWCFSSSLVVPSKALPRCGFSGVVVVWVWCGSGGVVASLGSLGVASLVVSYRVAGQWCAWLSL